MIFKEKREFEKLQIENLALRNDIECLFEELGNLDKNIEDENRYAKFCGFVESVLGQIEVRKEDALKRGYVLDLMESTRTQKQLRRFYPDGRIDIVELEPDKTLWR